MNGESTAVMNFPQPPRKGDTIMLISTSSPLLADQSLDDIALGVEKLGYNVRLGRSCRMSDPCGYAAAPADVRAEDLNSAFADSQVRAIWCTRGGSTAWRLLPLLNYEVIRANPKPFIGFSDVTTIHMALQQRCGMVSFHGPVANYILRWKEDAFSRASLKAALYMGRELRIENPPGEKILSLRPGLAKGILVGGNMALVTASMGTPWQLDTKGKILYLEDVGENVYRLDRMLSQLRYGGILEGAAGVALGTFARCRNSYREEYGPDELIRDFFRDYTKPVIYNVRSAHCAPMATLPLGAMCLLDGDRGSMTFIR